MADFASNIASVSNTAVHSVCRDCKCKYIEECDNKSESDYLDRTLQTPKKKKLLATAQYIYKTLFLEGKDSDITVLILGRAWKLHKVYINQSPYFASMFSGSWKESNEKIINIEIADPIITLNSLSIVLGSLYHDEVSLEPKEVVSILATASLLQLQGLIDECADIMIQTTNIKTVVPYYNAAVSYGVPTVKAAAKRWLEINLLAYGCLRPTFLKEITPELMTELIASPDLIAVKTEFSIYTMLREWLFAHMRKEEETLHIKEYFKNHTWTQPFLTTKEGKQFAAPFKALRMKHLVLHEKDINLLNSDNLIPPDWMHDVYREHWLHLLRINRHEERGPVQMTEEEFFRECFRFGKCIEKPGEYVWRWQTYGLNLLMTMNITQEFATFYIERKSRMNMNYINANHEQHNIILKICLISLDEQRQVKYIQNSGLLRLCVKKNMPLHLMTLDKQLTFPLYVSVRLQVVTPLASSKKENDIILVDT